MEAIIKAANLGDIPVEVKVVISNNPQAAGLQTAGSYNISTHGVDMNGFANKDEYEKKIVSILQNQDIELVVLAGYMRLLGPVMLSAFSNKIINIHPSLLPSFKGLDAQKQALEAGVKVSGCTVHFVDETLDGGKIILQKAVEVKDSDTEKILSARILTEEHKLYPKAIAQLLNSEVN